MANPKSCNKRKLDKPLMVSLVVLFVFFLTVSLPLFFYNKSILAFEPSNSDEVHYWHEILTVSQKGLEGGYYVVDEKPSQISFLKFGVQGPIFPLTYGVIASIFGWQPYSSVVFNFAFIVIAFLVYINLTGIDSRRLPLLGVLFGMFWPMIDFITSGMQESLHFALAISIAALFLLFIRKRTPVYFLSLFGLIFYASLVRFTWAILFIPLLNSGLSSNIKYKNLVAFILGGVMWLVSFFCFRWISSPLYSQYFVNLAHRPVQTLLESVLQNIGFAQYLHPSSFYFFSAVTQYSVYLGALFVVVYCGVKVTKSKQSQNRENEVDFAVISNLVVILLLIFTAYNIPSGYRVLSPHLLFSLLLLYPYLGIRFRQVIFVAQVLLIVPFLNSYASNHAGQFSVSQDELTRFEDRVMNFMIYREESDPWCNTLLIDASSYRRELTRIPAGIGLSVIFNVDMLEVPIRSHYLLTSEGMFRIIDQIPQTNFQLVAENTAVGNFYSNQGDDCID